MNLFRHVSNMYAILFIRLRSLLFVTLLHWFSNIFEILQFPWVSRCVVIWYKTTV